MLTAQVDILVILANQEADMLTDQMALLVIMTNQVDRWDIHLVQGQADLEEQFIALVHGKLTLNPAHREALGEASQAKQGLDQSGRSGQV